MKQRLLLCISMFLCLTSVAQKYSPMKAYNFYYDKNYIAAKECIDLCINDEKYNVKANTWLYKANIYYRLAGEEYSKKQQDTSYHIVFPSAPQEAFVAFQKAKELNKNIEASEMSSPDEALPRLYTLLFMESIPEIIANRFANAKPILEKAVASYEMQTPEYPLNGELYYYYAFTLESLNFPEEALIYYKKAIDDNSNNINVYVRLIEIYKKKGDKEAVRELINKGKQKNPNDPNVLVSEIEYYFWINDRTKGRDLLKQLPPSVYQSTDAVVNIANLYIKDSCFVEAEKLLKNAYQKTPDNLVIVHNLGVCCLNIGTAKYLEANKLDIEGKHDKAAVTKAEADGYLNRTATYFEEAFLKDSNNIALLQSLKEIYTRLLQEDKVKQTEIRIQSLEK